MMMKTLLRLKLSINSTSYLACNMASLQDLYSNMYTSWYRGTLQQRQSYYRTYQDAVLGRVGGKRKGSARLLLLCQWSLLLFNAPTATNHLNRIKKTAALHKDSGDMVLSAFGGMNRPLLPSDAKLRNLKTKEQRLPLEPF